MGRIRQIALAAAVLATLALAGCGGSGGETATAPPVRTFPIPGSPYKRIALTPAAVARVGLRTALAAPRGAGTVAVPYGAVFYDPSGAPSVYTSPSPRVYVRRPVQVERIAGGTALLRRGPTAGQAVVTVGADELYGVETGVQGEEK